ncbi:MAG: hypothetical protein WB558_22305 [Terriglobales bacterium]
MKKLALLSAVLLTVSAVAQNNISLPTRTVLNVKLETAITTSRSKSGDPFSARLTQPVMLDGKTVLPIGASVQGRVTMISEPRRISGKPTIGMFPETLVLPSGEHYMLNAALVDTSVHQGTDVNSEGQFKGKGYDTDDLVIMGAGTGASMLAGGLIGGGKGVLIGATIGATATVARWLGKRNSAELPAGTQLVMELSRPLEMTAAPAGQ